MRTPKRSLPTEPSALLFAAYHRKLLGLLLMHPEQAIHSREIARVTGVPVGSAHRELKRMERAGLISSARVGNQVRYQANRACPIFEELQSIVRKTSGLGDVLREALASLTDRIEVAFVFGSVAKGDEGPKSDIDLMIIGEVEFAEVVEALFPYYTRLGREVNPVVMSLTDFRKRLDEGHGFASRVMAGPKLVLMGALDEPKA